MLAGDGGVVSWWRGSRQSCSSSSSSQEARGNSAIRSILGALTETSGERMLSRKLKLGLHEGAFVAARGRDTLRPCRMDLSAAVNV